MKQTKTVEMTAEYRLSFVVFGVSRHEIFDSLAPAIALRSTLERLDQLSERANLSVNRPIEKRWVLSGTQYATNWEKR